jgi:hypothetical protein
MYVLALVHLLDGLYEGDSDLHCGFPAEPLIFLFFPDFFKIPRAIIWHENDIIVVGLN